MKKIICTLLVCCVLLFCVACGTSSAPKDNAEAPVKIAAMVAQEDQFMQLVLKGYKQAAEDLGVELMTASIGFDQAKEVELIDTYVQQGVQGIAIVPLSSDVSAEALRKASDAGVKVGISNMAIQNQEFIVGGYVSDNYELGQGSGIKAREFIEKELGGVAKIAVLQFMSLVPEVSDARYRGFVDEVSKLPGVEIVADQDAWVCINEIEAAMKGMLAPKFKEALIGHAEVRETYKVSKVGTVCGCYCTDGKIQRGCQVRVLRDNIVIHEGSLASLRRFKDDVKEVATGYECGMQVEKFNDIKVGDVIECFVMEQIQQ